MMTLLFAFIVGAAIWMLVFDMWLGQAERQYLWENARHELNLGPAVSLKVMMDEARASGLWVASGWSLFVAAAVMLAAAYAYRQGEKAHSHSHSHSLKPDA